MRLLILPLLLLSGFGAFGQKVSVKNGIVYNGDQPYCRLVKSGGLTPRFSVRSMDDRELLTAQFSNEQQRYNVSFAESGQVCFMDGTAGFGKILAKDVVACNVIADGKIRPAGERCFLAAHGGGAGAAGAVREGPDASSGRQSGGRYSIAERDHTRTVMVFGSKIHQDNTTIGTYTVRNTTSEGKVVKVYSFLLPNGEGAADAYVEGINAKSCRVITLKDNRQHTIAISSLDDMGIAKEIAGWLAGSYYL